MFANEYWKAATPGRLITVMDSGAAVPRVTVSPPSPVQIIAGHKPPAFPARF